MDFCHLIVTCLFSKLRLPFDNQKVKENYAILRMKCRVFAAATPGICFVNVRVLPALPRLCALEAACSIWRWEACRWPGAVLEVRV